MKKPSMSLLFFFVTLSFVMSAQDKKMFTNPIFAGFYPDPSICRRVLGGFVGCMYVLYATSIGKSSNNVSHFDWFKYRGDDEVYR